MSSLTNGLVQGHHSIAKINEDDVLPEEIVADHAIGGQPGHLTCMERYMTKIMLAHNEIGSRNFSACRFSFRKLKENRRRTGCNIAGYLIAQFDGRTSSGSKPILQRGSLFRGKTKREGADRGQVGLKRSSCAMTTSGGCPRSLCTVDGQKAAPSLSPQTIRCQSALDLRGHGN